MMPTARTARGNRIGLAFLGLLLLAGGAAALLAGQGVLGTRYRDAPLLTGWEDRWVDSRAWVWPVIGAVAALVTLLCLRWLLVQVRRDGVGSLQLEADRRRGATRVDARLLERAVSEEVGDYPGVLRASAQLAGQAGAPELHLTVALREGADLPAVRRRIDEEAVANLRGALEVDRLPLLLTLRLDVAKAA
jgi:hypothetical protein